jgi:hypothetical protein
MPTPDHIGLLTSAVLVLQLSVTVILGTVAAAVLPMDHGNRTVLLGVRRFAGWSALLTVGSGVSVMLFDSQDVPTPAAAVVTSWIPLVVVAVAGGIAARVRHLLARCPDHRFPPYRP